MVLYLALIFTAVILFITAYILHDSNRNRSLDVFPTPKRIPVLGSLQVFGRTPRSFHENLEKLQQTYGSVILIKIFFRRVLLVSDPQCLQTILSSPKLIHKSENYKFFVPWLGRGLLTNNGEHWKRQRSILTPAFHFKILEQFVDTFDAGANLLVAKLRKEEGKGLFDVIDYILLCALDIICESAMGTKVNAQLNSDSEYVSAVEDMRNIFIGRTMHPWRRFDALFRLTQDFSVQQRACQVLHDFTKSVIGRRQQEADKAKETEQKKKHAEEMAEEKKDDFGRKRKTAFLDLMLQYQRDGQPLTDDMIRWEVATFMFGGHDTTGTAISFTLYELSLNADIQQRIYDEQDAIFGPNSQNKQSTYGDLQQMKYLEMVIKEALRKYCIVEVFGRTVVTDDFYLNGVHIPKHTALLLAPFNLHRNPAYYPDPEKFDPERFSPENQANRHPYAYIPFSAGPRNCIGQKYAMLEMKAIISKLVRNFEFYQPNGNEGIGPHKVILSNETVLRSTNGIKICLRSRK